MQTITLLHERAYSRNGEALLAPIVRNRRRLGREYGIAVRFTTNTETPIPCDVLGVSAKVFRDRWGDGGRGITEYLTRARSAAGRILWFDTADGTGTTHFRVLPFVDGYVKNQLLRDRQAYQQTLYASRPYAHFIHERFGIIDDDAGEPHLNERPSNADLGKLRVGWHYGFAHYGRIGERLGPIWFRWPRLPRWSPHRWTSPSAGRPVAVSCRIGLRYQRATVAYPRQELTRRLAALGIATGRIPRRAYDRELRQSLAAISPFGYGEICYRDFEIMLAGAAMVKQNMDHLATWPDLWVANETYVPLAWDLGDCEERITEVMAQRARIAEIARAAQVRYRRALGPAGREEFCARFAALVA